MVRPKLSLGLLTLAALLLAGPAFAQFGNIFRDEPPRPPADVPAQPPLGGPGGQPRYYPNRDDPPNLPPQNYPQQNYPQQNYPQRQADTPPPQPLPAPMNLPPRNRPGGGTIQSQDLAPPPGTAQPQQQPGVPPQGQGTLSPLPGLPPGQRQPRGTPQQGAPQQGTSESSADEVVVEPPPQRITNPTAVFAGLDKITGRIISFDVAINETVQFGALQVTPKVCYSRPPTETPQTDSFVEVDEVTLQGEIKRIFTGWMFAASPGLHAVEHPIYDVWLTDCKGAVNPAVADVSADDQTQAAKPAARTPTPPRRPARAQQNAPGLMPALR